jgi:aspartyl aminopeptidase
MALIDNTADKVRLEELETVNMLLAFDHEECGSASAQGAGSSMFIDTIALVVDKLVHRAGMEPTKGMFMQSLRNSFLCSVDMAHALHPNYAGKHDATMAPKINSGLVIKHNANQRYATNGVSATIFRRAAKLAGVPVQEFTVRSDSACGSTIGPIISTLSGILTVDCGTPQFSMHSIREMMGKHDAYNGYAHLKSMLQHHSKLIQARDSK